VYCFWWAVFFVRSLFVCLFVWKIIGKRLKISSRNFQSISAMALVPCSYILSHTGQKSRSLRHKVTLRGTRLAVPDTIYHYYYYHNYIYYYSAKPSGVMWSIDRSDICRSVSSITPDCRNRHRQTWSAWAKGDLDNLEVSNVWWWSGFGYGFRINFQFVSPLWNTGISGDLLPFLIQSPADFYDTWRNDWRR